MRFVDAIVITLLVIMSIVCSFFGGRQYGRRELSMRCPECDDEGWLFRLHRDDAQVDAVSPVTVDC